MLLSWETKCTNYCYWTDCRWFSSSKIWSIFPFSSLFLSSTSPFSTFFNSLPLPLFRLLHFGLLVPSIHTLLQYPNSLPHSFSLLSLSLSLRLILCHSLYPLFMAQPQSALKGPCIIATATTQQKQPHWIMGNWVTSQEREGAGGAAEGGRCHTHTHTHG